MQNNRYITYGEYKDLFPLIKDMVSFMVDNSRMIRGIVDELQRHAENIDFHDDKLDKLIDKAKQTDEQMKSLSKVVEGIMSDLDE